jgi:hypothetical protein
LLFLASVARRTLVGLLVLALALTLLLSLLALALLRVLRTLALLPALLLFATTAL